MARLLFCLLTIYVAFPCLAANSGVLPEAKLEAARRGNHIEHVGGGVQAADSSLFAQAMEPPEDDSHKWFISVVSMRGCPACEKLKRDFSESDALRPYVNKADYRKSWSHYNEFQIEDQLQGWRFEKLQLKSFPVVILQPPLDGRFGESKTCLEPIVGYSGDAKLLAMQIRQRIKTYVEKYDQSHARPPTAEQAGRLLPRRQPPSEQRQNKNLDPPFEVLPPDDSADKRPDTRSFSLPPIDDFTDQVPLMNDPLMNLILNLMGQFGLTGLVLIGGGVFYLIREYRKNAGKKLLVSDEEAAKIEKIVEAIIAKKIPAAPSSPPSGG